MSLCFCSNNAKYALQKQEQGQGQSYKPFDQSTDVPCHNLGFPSPPCGERADGYVQLDEDCTDGSLQHDEAIARREKRPGQGPSYSDDGPADSLVFIQTCAAVRPGIVYQGQEKVPYRGQTGEGEKEKDNGRIWYCSSWIPKYRSAPYRGPSLNFPVFPN
jgi:hypothetical protein